MQALNTDEAPVFKHKQTAAPPLNLGAGKSFNWILRLVSYTSKFQLKDLINKGHQNQERKDVNT